MLFNEAYEIFHPIQNSFAWIPGSFQAPSSGAPIPFNKNRGKQRIALNGREKKTWEKRGGGFFLLEEEGRGGWPREKNWIAHRGVTQLHSEYPPRLHVIYRGGKVAEKWDGGQGYTTPGVRYSCTFGVEHECTPETRPRLFLSPSATGEPLPSRQRLLSYHFSSPPLFLFFFFRAIKCTRDLIEN